MVTKFDHLLTLDGVYWNDLSPSLVINLKRRGGLAAGQCAPHSFLNSTVGQADHTETVKLRAQLHKWLFTTSQRPSRLCKLDELVADRVEAVMKDHHKVSQSTNSSAQLMRDLLEECEDGSDNTDASLHTLRALCLMNELNLYVVTLHHLTVTRIVDSSSSVPTFSSEYETKISCRFYSFDQPGEVTFSDDANTIAVYQSIFESRSEKPNKQFKIHSVGHFESLQDNDGYACWKADDPVVVFGLERAVKECQRRHFYHKQIGKMKQSFDCGQQPVQLTIGQLALLSPPQTLRRDQITNRHFRPNLDDMCVKVVTARQSSASFFAYQLETQWGILSEEWFHHELRGCGSDVDTSLSAKPMPSAEVLADKQSHVSVSAAWRTHLQSNVKVRSKGVIPIIDRPRRGGLQKRPPAANELSIPCVHCQLRDGEMYPCAGCLKPIHIVPCGTQRQENQRITVSSQLYHSQECYNQAAAQDRAIARTRARAQGLSSENVGSAAVRRTRAHAKKRNLEESADETVDQPSVTKRSKQTEAKKT